MAAANLKPPVMAARYSHTTYFNVIFNYVKILEQSLNTNEPQLYAYFLLFLYYQCFGSVRNHIFVSLSMSKDN